MLKRKTRQHSRSGILFDSFFLMRCFVLLIVTGSFLPTSKVYAEDYISLTESAPIVMQTALRNRQFFGDGLTIDGGLSERSYLTGDWGGARTSLAESGIYTYAGMTQFFEGNLHGGNRSRARVNGSLDYGFWLDTGKANWWSGGAFFFHGETTWDESKNGDVGNVIPTNFDPLDPAAGASTTAFSEYYLIQSLGENRMLGIGKMDLSAWADTNIWANNWRHQFSSTSLVNGPQMGAVVPYTTWAAFINVPLSEKLSMTYTLNTETSEATQFDFDTIFNSDMVNSLYFSYQDKTEDGLPYMFNVLLGYGSGEQADFSIDRRHAAQEILGLAPIQQTDGNYGIFLSGSNYLSMRDSGHDEGCKNAPSRPLGWGTFFRYGWVPEDRNAFSHFVSAGIAGYGGPGSRIYDSWGLGWAGAYVSPDLRNAVQGLVSTDVWEHSIEAYYNYRITPSTHMTCNFQVSDSALGNLGTSYALGTRLQVDF